MITNILNQYHFKCNNNYEFSDFNSFPQFKLIIKSVRN